MGNLKTLYKLLVKKIFKRETYTTNAKSFHFPNIFLKLQKKLNANKGNPMPLQLSIILLTHKHLQTTPIKKTIF